VAVEVRRGDASDPLAGVARITSPGERTIDLIVGKSAWQRDLIARSTPVRIGRAAIPVVAAADLILLKLYAGGPQDVWDIDQLLDRDASLLAAVDAGLGALPADCAPLWSRIRAERTGSRRT